MAINYSAYYRLARLDKPVGIWLLLLPCWMGLALAGSFDILLYALFAAGSVIMRAAGCIVNDMADREFDSKVERTKNRPLASGEISMRNAFAFLALLLFLGLLILIQLPLFAIYLGFASVPLFVLYPFMKRITYWPQLFLGFTFNIGILIGFATVNGTISTAPVLLYFGAVFWTLGYDTIYAHQDKADDILAGVKSTALKLAHKTKLFISIFYAVFVTFIFLAANKQYGFNLISFALLCTLALHFTWQVWRLDINNPRNCMKLFKANIFSGLMVVLTLLASAVRFT